MAEKKRSGVDRRRGEARRRAYDLDYFLNGGSERRRYVDRRWRKEMRSGWVRVTKWSSIDVRFCNPKP